MADGERARKVENATGELVGVTLGDDLSRVIPSELANLGLPALRAVFAARYAARELMLYDSQGEQSTGQGAVIACVDTSHSMYEAGPGGVTREAWAKTCALALLDQARHAGRDFVGILFSAADKLQVFRFPADRPMRHRPGSRLRGDLPRRRHQLPAPVVGEQANCWRRSSTTPPAPAATS